jgi:hypothetical protein
VQVNVTVTFELFHPAAFGGGAATAVMVGPVFERLMVTVFVAVFPATSVAVPVICCPAPSVVTLTGGLQLATPDPLSLQVKVTVTLLEFQLLALGGGLRVAVIIGGVTSIFTVSVVDPVFPARSEQLAVTGVMPSVESAKAEGFPVGPESESAQTKVTVTGDLFQPAALGAGEGMAVTVGGVLSIFSIKHAVAVFPDVSVTVPQID